MNNKSIKVLIAKPGLDGHESGAKAVARALVDAGMEVVYTGTRQLPLTIVNSALQEDVDVVGLSILSGAHKELCSRIISIFKEKSAGDIPIILGGIIPDCDIPELKRMGVKEVFGPGSRFDKIVTCVQELAASRKYK
jgi:methylmalonyl-CoA mutase, C-terminal domain